MVSVGVPTLEQTFGRRISLLKTKMLSITWPRPGKCTFIRLPSISSMEKTMMPRSTGSTLPWSTASQTSLSSDLCSMLKMVTRLVTTLWSTSSSQPITHSLPTSTIQAQASLTRTTIHGMTVMMQMTPPGTRWLTLERSSARSTWPISTITKARSRPHRARRASNSTLWSRFSLLLPRNLKTSRGTLNRTLLTIRNLRRIILLRTQRTQTMQPETIEKSSLLTAAQSTRASIPAQAMLWHSSPWSHPSLPSWLSERSTLRKRSKNAKRFWFSATDRNCV